MDETWVNFYEPETNLTIYGMETSYSPELNKFVLKKLLDKFLLHFFLIANEPLEVWNIPDSSLI